MQKMCTNCGQAVRFIKRPGHKALIVNTSSVYFVPDDTDAAETFVTSNGKFRRGIKSSDGLKGFVLHECE